jgi:hypothetical protein
MRRDRRERCDSCHEVWRPISRQCATCGWSPVPSEVQVVIDAFGGRLASVHGEHRVA